MSPYGYPKALTMIDVLESLNTGSIAPPHLAAEMIKDPELIATAIKGMESKKARVRYGCGKALISVCETAPELVYRHFDQIARNLDSKNRIIVWQTMAMISEMAKVDSGKKIDEYFENFYRHLDDGYMVTVANVVKFSGKIAQAKPYLAGRIKNEILRTEGLPLTDHLTNECKLVIAQHALRSLDSIAPLLDDKSDIIEYARKFLDSPRKTLNLLAEKSLAKWERS